MNRIFLSALLLLVPLSMAAAENREVTPYGDYCKEYSVYGICRENIPFPLAVSLLERYYGVKGCRVMIMGRHGRFIIADIFKNYRHVDKIIFDTKTGRLRSIY